LVLGSIVPGLGVSRSARERDAKRSGRTPLATHLKTSSEDRVSPVTTSGAARSKSGKYYYCQVFANTKSSVGVKIRPSDKIPLILPK
jgi:hypothetical protein